MLQPRADDVTAEVSNDKIVVTRPGGLVLSRGRGSMTEPVRAGNDSRPSVPNLFTLDPQKWGFDREGDFGARQTQLVAEAAAAEGARRAPAQLNLARFYLARDLIPEAKGVLDVAASDEQAAAEGTPLLLRAVANVMMGRGADAMKDLSQASVASRTESVLWRSLALAQQGKWSEAREGFRSLETATATLPVELQRYAFTEAVRAAVEVRDYGAAQTLLTEFDTLGPAPQRDADLTLLKGRLMEGLGRLSEALTFYRTVAESNERPAAARARLREIALRQTIGELNRDDAATALESLTLSWRGDETEAEALQLLGRCIRGGEAPPRRVPDHAHRTHRLSEFRDDAAHPGRGRGRIRVAVSGWQRRRDGADRCAQPVLRFSRFDAGRPARRRDDPQAC